MPRPIIVDDIEPWMVVPFERATASPEDVAQVDSYFQQILQLCRRNHVTVNGMMVIYDEIGDLPEFSEDIPDDLLGATGEVHLLNWMCGMLGKFLVEHVPSGEEFSDLQMVRVSVMKMYEGSDDDDEDLDLLG